jgi:hypothetical protein
MTLGDDAAPPGHQHEPRASIPLGEIWTALTSEIGGIFTDNPDSTTDGSGTTASPVTVTMITTDVPVPVYTTTVDTTLVKTSFVTVRVTTQIPVPHTHTSHGGDPQSSKQSTITTTRQHTTLPEIATQSTPSPTRSGSSLWQTEQSATAPSSTSSPAASSHNSDRRHAIIGGLSGAIAGLVLIGALIIFFLRKRRRRDADGESRESMSEKGFRPILARKWSELTTRKSVAEAQPAVSRGSTPDLDGGLIRVSMENWARPYANGQSFRDSMGPRRLQVMNPDLSRPETPLRRSSDSNVAAGGFLRQPRTAFAAFLGNRSRGNSATRTPSRDANIPTIAIQPAGSSGHGTPQGATPSFRSYSSVTSLPVVEQHPPEDPFLTPPDERDELSTPSTPRRPGIAPLQSAGRTLSQLGSALNPFRSKSNMTMKSQASRRSVSTFFSSSSAGDPFALDRPSVYERSLRRQGSENDRSLRRAGSDAEQPEVPRWTVYEGT